MPNTHSCDLRAKFDLSPIGGTIAEFPGQLIMDEAARPRSLKLAIANIPNSVFNILLQLDPEHKLSDKTISVTLSDARLASVRVAYLNGIQLKGPSSVEIEFVVINVLFSPTEGLMIKNGKWVFYLCNVSIHIFDEKSEILPSLGSPPGTPSGWSLDKIRFTIAGRDWILRKLSDKQQNLSELSKSPYPVITATLTTNGTSNEVETLSTMATDLTYILSFALSRGIVWTVRDFIDDDGTGPQRYIQSSFAPAFNRGGFAPIDNYTFKVIKTLIEAAYLKLQSDPDWYRLTLQYYLQSQIADYLDIKCAILNILLDRISSKFDASGPEFEIDNNLDTTLDKTDFKNQLHTLCSSLSSKWTLDRTIQIVNKIKEWNASPSFPKKINRICENLRLTKPPGKFLATRHQLLHVGELNPDKSTVVEYWKDLEWLVLSMILRLFDYEGQVYHCKFGPQPILLKDKLEEKSA
jgi:hypothetical protein